MSDLSAIALMLGLFIFSLMTAAFLLRLMYSRCDDILSGVVNGIPVSLRSRWLFFLHDYIGVSFGVTMLAGVMAIGFLAAGDVVGDSTSVRGLAHVCAVVGAGFCVFNLLLGVIWMRHFASILRQAEAD